MVQYIETEGGEEEQMAELQNEKYTQEMLRTIFSGMHTILTAALRQPGLKVEVHIIKLLKMRLVKLIFDILLIWIDFQRRSTTDQVSAVESSFCLDLTINSILNIIVVGIIPQ